MFFSSKSACQAVPPNPRPCAWDGIQNTSAKGGSSHEIPAKPPETHTWASTSKYLIWDNMNLAFCSSSPPPWQSDHSPPSSWVQMWSRNAPSSHNDPSDLALAKKKNHTCQKSSGAVLVPGTYSWPCQTLGIFVPSTIHTTPEVKIHPVL